MNRLAGIAVWPATCARARIFVALLRAGLQGLDKQELRAQLALPSATVGSTLSNMIAHGFVWKHPDLAGRFVVAAGANEHVGIHGEPCLADRAVDLLRSGGPYSAFDLADALGATMSDVEDALAPLVDSCVLRAVPFACERGRASKYFVASGEASGPASGLEPSGEQADAATRSGATPAPRPVTDAIPLIETSVSLDGPRDDFSCAMYDSGALLISSNDVRITLPAAHARRLVRYLDCVSRDLFDQFEDAAA